MRFIVLRTQPEGESRVKKKAVVPGASGSRSALWEQGSQVEKSHETKDGAFLGGIVGGILCCLLFWSVPSLDQQHRISNNVDKKALDKTARSFQEAQIEEQIRYRGLTRHR